MRTELTSCGLNEDDSHNQTCLNTWPSVAGTVWEGLGWMV